ncbi:uncharacterized protein MELLADRAFT_115309 [Melampsora larici-populina 98AG31]|uniref:Putative gamma-glutamylcyclotransferase n=1 Tax=Melampsora larici-populina (strain 98AG31 / pathotype 3-4-7) TaxID=747676 RepID=F4R8X0_MELLP|nr:uncharacterized protein MELLADRAFT_115309 [Melampsora larici-populina 98AG31]EGG10883.1 hypothetical protein MELLADRAFT_115309 [Melampsora larici-populina 98AG31]
MDQSSPPVHKLFTYGTLMNIPILERVLGRTVDDLKFMPAILLNHSRLKLLDADYPAAVPVSTAKSILGRGLTAEESEVHGRLIIGLTPTDLLRLDRFEGEGERYNSMILSVTVIDESQDNSISSNDEQTILGDNVEASVYIYSDGLRSNLAPVFWTHEEFSKNHLLKWTQDQLAEFDIFEERREI